jgi:hypothetical protein
MFLALQGPELEPVLKNLPEIIKQASQSQLGILALLSIVLFGLAIYFFRSAPMALRAFIFLVFFGGVVAYGWEINRVASKPESKHYTGRIVDRATTTPIHEARVTVSAGSNHAGPYRSDSEGDFSFWLARKNPSEDADVHIEHESYRAYDRTVSSDQKTQLGDIRLEPLLASTAGTPQEPSATSPADSKAPQPQPINRPAATRAPASERPGGLAGRVVSPTIRNEIHPYHSAAATLERATAAPPPRIVENSSGQKLSGKGKDWSPWYEVRVGAAPAGFTLQNAEFWLTGDRACGSWAECKEVAKNDNEVVWSFRLQGHDEWGAPPQAYSEGHLKVLYALK